MDDFFSDLVSDGVTGRNTLSPLRDMATIQYAIRTNMQVVTTLTREEVMAGSVLLPKQIVQILTDAIWDCDLPGVKDDLQSIEYAPHKVCPIDLYARGILRGIEIALCQETRPLGAMEQECREVLATKPLDRNEQTRLQGLLNSTADARGWTDRELRRMVAFSVIQTFALSGIDARGLPDSHWTAFAGGIMAGFDKAHGKGLSVRHYELHDVSSKMLAARGNDIAQASITSSKSGLFPTDEEGLFSWALETCDTAKSDASVSEYHANAIKCMSTSYALPIVLAATRKVFNLACEADGMSASEVMWRLASAMYEHAAGRRHDVRMQTKAMVQFDAARGMSADLVAAIIYGTYWLGGYASHAIGWSWEYLKAKKHRNTMQGRGEYHAMRISHARDMEDGYENGWQAGEQSHARIHRLTTTAQIHSIEEGFTSKVVPLSERFDSLGYSALFLYLPLLTPEMPCLL